MSQPRSENPQWFPNENPHPVMRAEANGTVIYANPSSKPLLRAWHTNVSKALPADCVGIVREVLASGKYREMEVITGAQTYLILFTPLTSLEAVNIYGVDITERKEYEAKLLQQASSDSLTGLPNLHAFNVRLEDTLHQIHDRGGLATVFVIGLDHFKEINESLGHDVGDLILCGVAERLRSCANDTDTVARGYADEFLLLQEDTSDCLAAEQMAETIAAGFGQPFHVDGQNVHISASVGAAVFPLDHQHADELLRDAETAMEQAKKDRRGSFAFYVSGTNTANRARHSLLEDLRDAVERKEFVAYYQPQYELATRRLIGMEVLLRWDSPRRGFVPPDAFIPLAEERGLIEPIGEWVLREACRQARIWFNAGVPKLRIAVNLSGVQFGQADLVEVIEKIVAETEMDPAYLELEITETAAMRDAEKTISILDALQRSGMPLAIDDFGTGYSSLNYLRRFPIEKIKIDRSFVSGVTDDPHNAAICETVVRLSHGLGLRTLAEGIEEESELEFLRGIGCEEGQGYLFARPMAAKEMSALLSLETTETCRETGEEDAAIQPAPVFGQLLR